MIAVDMVGRARGIKAALTIDESLLLSLFSTEYAPNPPYTPATCFCDSLAGGIYLGNALVWGNRSWLKSRGEGSEISAVIE